MAENLWQKLSFIFIVKVVALGLIWWLFFSSPPPLSDADHLFNPATTTNNNSVNGAHL